MGILLRARRGGAAFVGCAGIALLFSCTSLPDVDHGVCGNHVVDDATEDCDQQSVAAGADAGTATKTCRAPGTVGQCRYDCSASADQCPVGWGCGNDKICREATGSFDKLTGLLPFDAADHAKTADFDGDGIGDILVWNENRGLRIYYGDPTGRFNESFDLPLLTQTGLGGLQLATGHLAGNPQSDVVFTINGGVTVWEGTNDRQLLPIANPSFEITNTPTRLIGLDMVVNAPGEETLLYLDVKGGHAIVPVSGLDLSDSQVIAVPDKDASQISGEVFVGQLRESTGCDEFAFAYKEDTQAGTRESTVNVFSSCDALGRPNSIVLVDPKDPNKVVPNPARIELPKVKLPDGFFLRDTTRGATAGTTILDTPFRMGDLNGDGHLDMVLNAKDAAGEGGNGATVFIAYGVGDGTFNSKLPVGPGPGDGVASRDPGYFRLNPKVDASEVYPLAFGQMTKGDLVPDFIFPGGVQLETVLDGSIGIGSGDAGADASTTATQLDNVTIFAGLNETFTEGVILDVNGDGNLDAVVSAGTTIAAFTGTGGRLMNRSSYPVSGDSTNLVSGDFDGDGALDVAFRQEGVAEDTLSILFGRFGAPPEGVHPVGRLGHIEGVGSLVLGTSQFGSTDAISDLGIVSTSRDGKQRFISILEGATDRRIVSPLLLRDQESASVFHLGAPTAYAVGQFMGDPHADLATLAFDDGSGDTSNGFHFRAWPLQGTGEASLGLPARTGAFVNRPLLGDIGFQRQGTQGTITGTASWNQALLGAVDLDPPGANIDELVMLVPPLPTQTGGGQGILQISDYDAAAAVFRPRPAVNLGAKVSKDYFGDGTPLLEWQLDFADLDGDGSKDILVEFSDDKGSTLQVYLNTKKHDLADPKVVPMPPGKQARAFAVLNADGDVQKEIAILTDDAVYVADVGSNGDVALRPAPLANVPGGGYALAGGDVDGDGVDDLVLVPKSGDGFRVFKGEARLR